MSECVVKLLESAAGGLFEVVLVVTFMIPVGTADCSVMKYFVQQNLQKVY